MLSLVRDFSSVVALLMAAGSPPMFTFITVRAAVLLLPADRVESVLGVVPGLHWPEAYFTVQAVVTGIALITYVVTGICAVVRRRGTPGSS